jgi:hypothetical protein
MDMKLRTTIGIVVLIAVFAAQCYAIPAFARKYDMSCTTCHSPAPKLKPYGDEFARNGYQFPDKEPPRYFRETGDDRLLLMREFPVAMRFELYGQYEKKAKVPDFQTPLLLKFISGGQIARDISYYFYFFFSEKGSVAGIEDAFILFNNIGGVDFDVYIGQYQVTDPLFKRELRLPLEDYEIYSTVVGSSKATLTYDRGIMLTYKAPTKTELALEIMNGNGLDTPSPFYDNDKNKNFLLRASQEINRLVRVGALGYMGSEMPGGTANDISMIGPDFTISLEPIELNVQYVYREDTNPLFTSPAAKIATRGGFTELIYSPNGDKSIWYATLLYNNVSSDISALKYQSIALDGFYLLARNIRLGGELQYDMEAKSYRITTGIFTAF